RRQRDFTGNPMVEHLSALYSLGVRRGAGHKPCRALHPGPARRHEFRAGAAGNRGARISRRHRGGGGAAHSVGCTMAGKTEQSRKRNGHGEQLEWVVATISSVIVIALVGFILYEAITRTGREPDFRFAIEKGVE